MLTPRKVIIVTSSPDRCRSLASMLREDGYEVEVTGQIQETVSADLAMVDVSDEALWSTAEKLAENVFMLIVDDPTDMARGFELGADDCVLVKAHPFEVVARCDAVLRRTSDQPDGDSSPPSVYVDRRLWVNFGSRQVWVGESPARLTPREFRLLHHLIQHRDSTLSHEDLLESVWDRSLDSDRPAEVLKQYIWRLRQKIEVDPDRPEIIVTDPGEGYRFVSHLG